MGICTNQWRAAVGRWANFCFSRALKENKDCPVTGYWCHSLFTILVMSMLKANTAFRLVILAILLIVSGTVHINPGPESKKMLKIGNVNMRSLCPGTSHKVEDLHDTLCTHEQCDIVAVTETWLNNTIDDKQIELPEYQVFRRDRDRNGGGVALYFTNSLPAKRLTDFDAFDIEVIAVETKINQRNVIILCCYRPPTKVRQDIEHFLLTFENIISLLLVKNPSCFLITGDFNDRCITWHDSHVQSDLKKKFYNLLRLFNLFQIIEEPTHIHENNSPSLILLLQIPQLLSIIVELAHQLGILIIATPTVSFLLYTVKTNLTSGKFGIITGLILMVYNMCWKWHHGMSWRCLMI